MTDVCMGMTCHSAMVGLWKWSNVKVSRQPAWGEAYVCIKHGKMEKVLADGTVERWRPDLDDLLAFDWFFRKQTEKIEAGASGKIGSYEPSAA